LIDAKNGQHLWAENYDRDLKDIFAMQNEITGRILTALEIELTEGEQARLWGKGVDNYDLLLKRMELRSLWRKGTKESLIRHGQIGKELVNTAPESDLGYMALAWTYWNLAYTGQSSTPRETVLKAFQMAQKAISLNELNPQSHAVLGQIYLLMRQYEKAIAAGNRAIALNPNGAMVHGQLGIILSYVEKVDEAISQLKIGIRLNPYPDYWYYFHLGRCYAQKGQYEKALMEYKKSLQISPGALGNYIGLTMVYALLDRIEEARGTFQKLLELYPDFSEDWIKAAPYKNPANIKLIVDALHKAGLPRKAQLAIQSKPAEQTMQETTALSHSDTVYDLNGEWDAIYESAFGVSKDVVKITQEGNKFVGIKLIGTQWVPKGSETIKGDLEQNRFKSLYLNNGQAWAPADGKINEKGNEIILKQHIDSMGITIDVKLSRK
jgi:tetratricopeptide (TPR) repeat protein